MQNKRIIGRLDIKGDFVIKGIQFEGLRKIGLPREVANQFYEGGLDELFYLDSVASLYSRDSLLEVLTATAKDVFIPITVGGGVRSVNDARELLRAGADKVAINSAALKSPELLETLISEFGAQCVVVSVEAKRIDETWFAFYDSGRETSFIEVSQWLKTVSQAGVGEIVVTSVDRDGARRGPDFELAQVARNAAPTTPMVFGGGIHSVEDVVCLLMDIGFDGVVIGAMFHYGQLSPRALRAELVTHMVPIRDVRRPAG